MEVIDIDKRQRVNEEIRVREVRLIDEAGKQVGIVSTKEALALARSHNLDLVEVAPHASPPVCRILDYGKFMYERAKKEREARKAQKTIEVKEVRVRPKTGEYHVGIIVKRIRAFIADGAKVKVRVRFRGREITHPEIGRDMLERVAAEVADVATVEQQPLVEGRSLLMVLAPSSAPSQRGGGG